MNKTQNDLVRALRGITLLSEKRAALRERLSLYADFNPVMSPWYMQLRRPALYALATLLVVSLIGSGVVYAAEGALPGDVLYPVKVSVVEPIKGAFAVSPAAKAKWNTELAARRLDEASALAARGELDATTTNYLAAQFAEHATSSAHAQLEVHERLLTHISENLATSTQKTNTEHLLGVVSHLIGTTTTTNATSTHSIEPIEHKIDQKIEDEHRVETHETPVQLPHNLFRR